MENRWTWVDTFFAIIILLLPLVTMLLSFLLLLIGWVFGIEPVNPSWAWK